SRRPDEPTEPVARFDRGQIFIMLYRGEYWQCGYVIPKGGFEEIRRGGLEAFRERLATVALYAGERAGELRSWEDVKLLTVRVDRLERWYRLGLLCIGDAAHAMSPIGGVGINLALQDAVAAANLLGAPLSDGRVDVAHLHRVQRRRELPTRLTQWLQVTIQKRVIARVLRGAGPLRPPWPLRLLAETPLLTRIPARLIGIGARPEHVRTPVRRTSA
ncbi:MAG TPA: FAD-dependent monooxygenase, partial [Methylomirabilota bacterium]|nr:FAD-dependent monooxygenase [Methylomirabilota bacterium]